MASTQNQTMHQAEPDNHAATNDQGATNDNITKCSPHEEKSWCEGQGCYKDKIHKSTSKGKSEEASQSIPSRTYYDNGATQIAFHVDGMVSINIFTLILILIFACSCYGRS